METIHNYTKKSMYVKKLTSCTIKISNTEKT